MSTRHPESVRRLLEAIAREADPDRLLLAVAEDRALLGAARRLLAALDGADPAVELDFRSQCLARGVPREVALERLRLIVLSLDGPGSESGSQPDPYEVLQVSPEAGAEEIKRAFRQASFAWHPDRNPERPEAAERFRKIQQAYALLSDAERRRAYDRSRGIDGGAGADAPPPSPAAWRRWSGWRRGPSLLLVILVLLAVSLAFDERRRVFRPTQAPPRSAPASQTSSETSGKSPDATAPAAGKAASQSSTSAVQIAALREPDELSAAPGGSGHSADQLILYGWERRPQPEKPAPAAVPAAPVAKLPAQAPAPAVAHVPKPEPAAPPAATDSASAPAGTGAKLAKATAPSREKQSPQKAPSKSLPAAPSQARGTPAATAAASGTSSRERAVETAPPVPPRTTVVAALPSPSGKAERSGTATAAPAEAAAAVGGASKNARGSAKAAATSAAGSGNGVKPGSAGAMGKGPPGEAAGSDRVGAAAHPAGIPDGKPAAPAPASPAPPAKPAASEQTVAADDPAVMEERIRNFLDRYTRTFARLDPAAFRALFEADAVENGRTFQDLQSQYEKNFRELAGVDYRIRMRGWRASRSSCTVTGTFALTARYRDERVQASQGTIELVLTPRNDGFRVSRLQYSFQR